MRVSRVSPRTSRSSQRISSAAVDSRSSRSAEETMGRIPHQQDAQSGKSATGSQRIGERLDAISPARKQGRTFLLSPARASGVRMGLLLRPAAGFALAHQFQREGAAVGALFEFASGLYFRGKLAYARRFGTPLVIVPGRGLVAAET